MSRPDTLPTSLRSDADARPIGHRQGLVRIDRRTRLARRRAALLRAYADQLGGWAVLSAAVRLRLEATVEQLLVAEHVRGRFLAGEAIDADDVVRSARAADLALKRLGLVTASPAPINAPALADYIAAKAGASA